MALLCVTLVMDCITPVNRRQVSVSVWTTTVQGARISEDQPLARQVIKVQHTHREEGGGEGGDGGGTTPISSFFVFFSLTKNNKLLT